MRNMEYTTMYDDSKKEIITKLKALSYSKRIMLLNKYARQAENIYSSLTMMPWSMPIRMGIPSLITPVSGLMSF